MKTKWNYIMAVVVALTAVSCSDFLDIKPMDKMVLEDYWKTQNDVESTVLACYRAMEEDGFMERIILGGELRSDNVIVDETKLKTPADIMHINDLTIKPANDQLKWQDFYRVINYCNAVLEFAPGVMELDPNYTPGFMRAHQAEAYAIRALAYFYLVRIYRDVPYIDFHYKEDTQQFLIPQTPGDEILHHLTEQLLTAEKYAMASWGVYNTTKQRGRVTKNMIRALLADIYLWLGEYDHCIAACERIEPDIVDENEVLNYDLMTGAELNLIGNKRYMYESFTRIFFNKNSMESIFELQFNTNEKSNSRLVSLYYGDANNIGNLAAASLSDYDDKQLFSEKDVRGKTSFTPASKGGNFQGFSKVVKYFGVIAVNEDGWLWLNIRNVDTNTPNWIFYRVADVYLMKAEALVERNGEGDLDKALELVNLTYLRANPDGAPLLKENYNTRAAMRKLVLDERQREFLFEGKRWFDLVRMARREDREAGKSDAHPDVLSYMIRKYTYNGDVIRSKLMHTDALYLPIHTDELINNPTLKQNPYYKVNMD
ncbi:MAG: RagB/SusD family nutrient uptake outer membrane protein [Dysgonamonadaceae bacterium]|nr:RagB/SusD family nutrient uptake outer membrane protein [Dysgonamonadaceae bacterium]